jgi:hypothetical protein
MLMLLSTLDLLYSRLSHPWVLDQCKYLLGLGMRWHSVHIVHILVYLIMRWLYTSSKPELVCRVQSATAVTVGRILTKYSRRMEIKISFQPKVSDILALSSDISLTKHCSCPSILISLLFGAAYLRSRAAVVLSTSSEHLPLHY